MECDWELEDDVVVAVAVAKPDAEGTGNGADMISIGTEATSYAHAHSEPTNQIQWHRVESLKSRKLMKHPQKIKKQEIFANLIHRKKLYAYFQY